MLAVESAPALRRPRVQRWVVIGGIVLLLVIAGAFIFLLVKWPFTRNAVEQGLGQLVEGTVQIQKFRSTYFPSPGCVAEGIAVRGPHVTGSIRKVTFQAGYASLLTGQSRIERVLAEGLYVRVLRQGQGEASQPGRSNSNSKVVIGAFLANGSVLEVARADAGREPLRFDFHELAVQNAGAGRAMRFRMKVRNPEPPGEIACSGQFGPWNSNDHAKTPLAGDFTFQHADLGQFHLIGGILSADGKFKGILERVDVNGKTSIPDFSVKSSGHEVGLAAQFHAVVNGTNGDVHLEPADTRIENTTIVSQGDIAGKPGEKGKTVSMVMNSRNGHIQDLMRMLMKSNRPPMTGVISFRATAMVPPDQRKFLERLKLDGDFGIGDAQFTAPRTQQNIDILSERARGDKKDDADPENVISNLKGHVVVRNGVARFSHLTFAVPGALANLDGTFNLLNQRIDLSGTLAMQAELSEATKGVKSFLLKALDPFFKKKHAGAVIPVRITGTYPHPSYGIAWTGKKNR